ncbi:GNAT family N-acetyltransferase [Streptomyces sp. A3M-1-3]|uniref:GNAT family N-acetyltransferase n=1 Tax=Streptomyces sp. A3M-1-3 TaxID=2962044 RepID=UPI0020B74985|nr:GNAT family N-acetyltransferase [Streptomyces sp. A3M-1-3]MCP3819605.1 GNAT family N-acetyltransferase [Streptomyces sp. A3M-1-3]
MSRDRGAREGRAIVRSPGTRHPDTRHQGPGTDTSHPEGTSMTKTPVPGRRPGRAGAQQGPRATAPSAVTAADPARPGKVTLREPEPGDLGWIVQRHGALYAAEFGWNADFEGLVARIVADFAQDHDPHLERVWIAELDGRPVGSVMCVRDEVPGTARLRLLLVDPAGRGHHIGEQLVGAVVDFAREAGYRELVLWTNDVLAAARKIYQRAGFTLVAEKPHRSYGVDLVGQDWRLGLHGSQEGTAT